MDHSGKSIRRLNSKCFSPICQFPGFSVYPFRISVHTCRFKYTTGTCPVFTHAVSHSRCLVPWFLTCFYQVLLQSLYSSLMFLCTVVYFTVPCGWIRRWFSIYYKQCCVHKLVPLLFFPRVGRLHFWVTVCVYL